MEEYYSAPETERVELKTCSECRYFDGDSLMGWVCVNREADILHVDPYGFCLFWERNNRQGR